MSFPNRGRMVSGFESEYPSNNHKSKVGNSEPNPAEKIVTKVTEGTVIRQKPSLTKRFTTLFVAGDPDSVVNYVLKEVMLPKARDLIADAATEFVERMIFGEARNNTRRTNRFTTGHSTPGYTSYNRYATSNQSVEKPRAGALSATDRATHQFDRIILETRAEADFVLARMFDLISTYEQVTVADYYQLVGEPVTHVDHKWGWIDIRGADVQRTRLGYVVHLSTPISLS